MVHTAADVVAGPADELTARVYSTFFEVLTVLLDAGVTTVAEAAFGGAAPGAHSTTRGGTRPAA
jgi:hypothetical protein